jgi:hypothetical protein
VHQVSEQRVSLEDSEILSRFATWQIMKQEVHITNLGVFPFDYRFD